MCVQLAKCLMYLHMYTLPDVSIYLQNIKITNMSTVLPFYNVPSLQQHLSPTNTPSGVTNSQIPI